MRWDNGVAGAPVGTDLVDCGNVYRSASPNGTGLFSLVAFDLGQPGQDAGSSAILGNSGVVYASTDAFYVATYEDAHWLWLALEEGDSEPRPGTSVHKFRLGGAPVYAGSGRVDGQVLNQFSMDEHEGHLRIATTENRWWRDSGGPVNRLYVLAESDGGLAVSGRLEGIGKPNETIFAARFQGERGYIVTAERIDPLYTLDLSDPAQPRQVGELEVPGFSTYLHPLADDRLLAIGRDGANRLQLSLFDVSDFAAPRRVANYSATAGAWSGAEHDHRAFTYYPERGLLAIPVLEQTPWTGFTDQRPPFLDALRLFAIGPAAIEPLGSVDHTGYYDRGQAWYFPRSIERSLFKGSTDLGDYVYGISAGAVTVTDVDSLGAPVDTLVLPLADDGRWYSYATVQ